MKRLIALMMCAGSLGVGGCQNPNSNNVGRYVQFQSDAFNDGRNCLLDTEEGILYTVPVKPFTYAYRDAILGKEVPDSSKAHWVPIVQFDE